MSGNRSWGFFDDDVELIGVEAGGLGVGTYMHGARLAYDDASVGVAQGYKTYFLQNDDGNMNETHSVAAGLDYIGINPIFSHLWEQGKVRFEAATDEEVKELFPKPADTKKLAELMKIVKSAEDRNTKINNIVANAEEFGGVVLTLLGKFA